MPLTYERDPKVPANVGNQYPSVEPVNPFPMKDSSASTAYPADNYSAPVTGSYNDSFNPSTTSMSGSYTDTPMHSSDFDNNGSKSTTFGLAPGSTYGSGATSVQGTSIIHDEHIRDRTIPGQGITYEDMKAHEKQNKNADHAFVAAPDSFQSTTVQPKIEGLASDASGRFDGFVDGPDGLNSQTPKHGKHAAEAAAAHKATDSHTAVDSETTGEHKKGKIGQMLSNLTHKNHANNDNKEPMQVYEDSVRLHEKDPVQMYQDSLKQQNTVSGSSATMSSDYPSTSAPSTSTNFY